MKKSRYLLSLLVIMALVLVPFPVASADNDDFTVSYDFLPDDVAPKGADMRLTLTITNTGATDITWVGVGIDTSTPFTGRWGSSPPIHPGDRRDLTFTVPFQQGDLNETRLMQVTMNNNATPSADGSVSFRFSIHGVDRFIIPVSTYIAPAGGLHAGDTVTVTMRYRNECTTHPALHFITDAWLTKDGAILNNVPEKDHGMLAMGAEVTHTFSYTLRDFDVGTLMIHYRARYTLMNRTYNDSATLGSIPVTSADPDIGFTATLTAEPTEITMGDIVHFRVTVHNTGDDAIGRFEICNTGGGTEMEAEGMHPGDSGSVTIDKHISASGDYSFVVIGRTGDQSHSEPTNTVHITATMEGIPFGSSAGPAEVSPSASGSPATSLEAGDAASVSFTPSPSSAQTSSGELIPGIPSIVLYIVIGVLAVAVAVLVTVLVLRRGKNKRAG